jgi:hypothetical protein
MPMPDGSSDAKHTALFETVGHQLADSDHAVFGKMFGMPCLEIRDKAFAGLYQDAMVFKLGGDAHAQALALEGSHLFDPSGMGRAMKEWVVVEPLHSKRYAEFGRQALDYVAGKG